VHHHIETPIRLHIPAVPANERASDHLRNTGQTFQHFFMQHNPTTIHVDLKNQGRVLPIEYASGSGQPSDGGREIVKSYGPANLAKKLAKERYTPFEGAPLPAPAGGATAPMPVKIKKPLPEKETIKIRREDPPIPRPHYIKPTIAKPPTKEKIKIRRDDPIPRPDGINPEFAKPPKPVAPVPIEQVVGKKSKKDLGHSFTPMPRGKPQPPRRKVDPDHVEIVVTGKRQKERDGPAAPPPRPHPGKRFPGKGQKLGDEAFPPGHRLDPDTKIWLLGKQGAPKMSGSVVPFSGRGQKLYLEGGSQWSNAVKRMREIYEQSEAAKRARDTVERQSRALIRGGAPGDVVALGKRTRRGRSVPAAVTG